MALFKDAKEVALRDALRGRDPFCIGVCVVPDYQLSLYYRNGENDRHIDFSKAGPDDVEKLYRVCKPAPFGRGEETVLDESYRRAGKMDLDAFSTLFDPRSLGVHDQIAKRLLTDARSGDVEMELYKLNVYGEGDFFKPHKDTPRSQDMFGSLVVVLPSKHEGGQLVLRHREKEWTIDFSGKLAEATEPLVYFVAFFGDIDHEVLPVTSGYRVTLTYNLYRKPSHPTANHLPTPFLQKLKRALIEVLDDNSKLPHGGYLGFGLAHEYVHSEDQPAATLVDQLKGSDRALADMCDELGLSYSLKFLYREYDVYNGEFCLLTSQKLHWSYKVDPYQEPTPIDYLEDALEDLTSDEAEGVVIIQDEEYTREELIDRHWFMDKFYRDPVSEVLEITPMRSSVSVGTPYVFLGNEASVEYLYGEACMMIAVNPVESRAPLEEHEA